MIAITEMFSEMSVNTYFIAPTLFQETLISSKSAKTQKSIIDHPKNLIISQCIYSV